MKTTASSISRKKQASFGVAAACLVLALIACRASGGQSNPSPVPPTNPPVQQPQPVPPTDTIQPTAVPTNTVAQPTTAPTATDTAEPTATVTATPAANTDAVGDQVQQLLDQLNQMNQKGDPFGDLPQP
ncbi:MAG TPA: hypothetical protein VMC09_10465 [Anaerolineales bacterium]|nr:hypothetical protein [Anaerolineales bacterium]